MNRRTISLRIVLFCLAVISPLLAAENTPPSPTATPVTAASPAARDEALQLLAKARTAAAGVKEIGYQLDVFRRLAIAEALAGETDAFRDSIQKARHAADEVNKKQPADWQKAETLAQVCWTEIQAGDLVSARKTADAMPVSEKRNKTLAEIGIRYAQVGEFAAAFATVSAMRNPERFIDHYTPASVVIAVAVTQARKGDRDDAWKTLAQIDDYEARLWAFSELAATQARAGDIEGALATADQIPLKIRRALDARDYAFKAVSQAQIKADHFDAALATAERISDRQEKERMLAEIGKAQAAKGDLAAAAATNEKIREGSDRDPILVAIVAARARSGDIAAAQKEADAIHSESAKADALLAIALAQAAGGGFDAAMATLKPVSGSRETSVFSQLAVAIYQKDKAAALKAMDAARSAVGVGGLREEEGDGDRYQCVRAYAMMGEFERAETESGVIISRNTRVDAEQTIAVEMAAARSFAEAARWVEKLDDPVARSQAFSQLVVERLRPPRLAK